MAEGGVAHLLTIVPNAFNNLIVGLHSIRLERCPVSDFRHTIDRVSAVSSQRTPLALCYRRERRMA